MLIHYVSSIERDGKHTYHFALTVRQWVNLNSYSTCSVCQKCSQLSCLLYAIFNTIHYEISFTSTVYRNYIFFSCGPKAPSVPGPPLSWSF